MTQVPVQAAYSSRKRLADGPLPICHPAKHPRVMANDPTRDIIAFVASIFTSAPDTPAPPAISNTQSKSSSLVCASPLTPPPPAPESDSESSRSSDVEPTVSPPKVHRILHRDRAFSSASQPPASLRADSDLSQSGTISRSSVSSRMQHSSQQELARKGFQSIVHASQWQPISEEAKTRSSCTNSSIASTSKTTLESSPSFNSGTGRRSSATSVTSTSSAPSSKFDSLTPHSFNFRVPYDPPPFRFGPTSANWKSIIGPTFSRASTSSQGVQLPKYVSSYTPNPDFLDSELLYKPALVPQQGPKGKKRRHILESKHKADLARRRNEIKQDVRDHEFIKAKNRGYGGTREEFNDYADYVDTARRAVGGEAETKQPSDIWQGLHRSINDAYKSFNGPEVQKAFAPTLDQLSRTVRAKDAAIDDRLRPPRPQLPSSLPSKDEEFVAATLRKIGVIAKVAREQILDLDIRRLHPRQWLNDEIINFYGALIMARAEEQKENVFPRGKILRAFYLSSFFWPKLTHDGYEKGRLAKWTKKVDIFSRDVVLIPVNHGNAHWTAAAINFQKKRFESYDSMGMAKEVVWKHLREYVRTEHLNKKQKPFDYSGWIDWAPDDTPQQDNGYDCGVFTCQFLESISRGEDDFVFSQEDMPYLRRRMVWEIANVRLRTDV